MRLVVAFPRSLWCILAEFLVNIFAGKLTRNWPCSLYAAGVGVVRSDVTDQNKSTYLENERPKEVQDERKYSDEQICR